MNEVLRIAMQADAGQVIRAFSMADTAGKKFGATLEALNFGGRVVMGTLDNMAKKVRNFGLKVAAGGSALGLSFLGATRESAAFEMSLNNVNSLVNRSGSQVAKWGQQLLNMSRTGVQGVQTLAKGLYNVASAGFYGSNGLKVLDASQKAATAGMTDVDTASKAIISSLRSYGQGADQARKVSDYLFQSVNTGIYTFEELAQNIGDILPMAAAAKVSLKEVAGSMAAVTLAGLSPAEGATALQRLIQQMVDPSKELAKTFQRLGYESGAQALQVDGLYKVMQKLRKAGGDNLVTLLQWFPEIRAARGALALMSAEGRNYTRSMQQMDKATSGQGATQRALNEQMKSLNNQWAEIKNKVQAFLVSMGATALPFLHIFAGLVNSGADLLALFDHIPGPIRTFIGLLIGSSAIVLTLGGAFIALRAKSLLMALGFKGIAASIRSIAPEAAQASGALGGITRQLDRMGSLRSAASGRAGLIGRVLFGSQGMNVFQRAGAQLTAMSMRGAGVSAEQAAALSRQSSGYRSATATVDAYNSKLTIMGRVQAGLGSVFSRTGDAAAAFKGKIRSVVGETVGWGAAIGGLVTTLFAFGLAWKSSGDEAAAAVAKIDSNIKGGSVTSLEGAQQAVDRSFEKINNFARRSTLNKVGTGVAKGLADLATNVIGLDVIKDSPQDLYRLQEKLDGEQKKIFRLYRHYQDNFTEIALKTGLATKGQGLDGAKNFNLMTTRAMEFDHVAKIIGVDLSKSYNASAGARAKMIAHFSEAKAGANAFGKTLENVTDADIKRIQDLQKAIDKMGQATAQNFFSQLSLGDSYDPNARQTWERIDPNKKGGITLTKMKGALIPAQKQIADYYQSVIDNTTTFVDDLNKVVEAGLDPQAVMEITSEGPQKAGKALHQVVADTSGSLVQLMNQSYQTMGSLSDRAISYNRIVMLATQDKSGELFRDYRKALTVQNEIYAQGGKATMHSIAQALAGQGFTAGDIRKINEEFGLNIQKALDFKLPSGWEKNFFPQNFMGPILHLSKDLKGRLSGMFQDEYRTLLDFTKLSPEQATIYMRLRLKGDKEGLKNFFDSLPDDLREQTLKVSMSWNEDAKVKLAQELEGLQRSAKTKKLVWDTLLSLDGKKLNTQSVRDLQLHYGLTDKQLKYYVKLADQAGVPGAKQVLADLNAEVGAVHYYKIKLSVDSKTGKEGIKSTIDDLITNNSKERPYLMNIKFAIDRGDLTQAKTFLSDYLGQGQISRKTYEILFKLIGDEQTSAKIRTFLRSLPADRNIDIDTVMKVLGAEGALTDVTKLQTQLNLTPQEVSTLLAVLGTDESIAAVGGYILSLAKTPKDVNTFLKSIDVDPQTRWRIQQWMSQHNGDVANFYAKMQAQGESETNASMGRVRANANQGAQFAVRIHAFLDDATRAVMAGLRSIGAAFTPAQGGIIRYAKGGMSDDPHVAQFAKAGAWRVWAEPETGGEAYIPLALSKRSRSMGVLHEVANRFGMMVTPRGTTHYAEGGITPVPSSTVTYGGAVVHAGGNQVIVHGNADRSLLNEVSDMMDRRDRDLARKLSKVGSR